MNIKKAFFSFIILLLSFSLLNPLALGENETQEEVKQTQNNEATFQPFQGLPIRKQNQIIEKKTQQAKTLSNWVYQTLEKEQASVGIIARKGPPLTVFLDKTGLTHVAFVFKRPDTKQWVTYSLYTNPNNDYKTSNLWQETVEDFYYGQSGKQTDSLMLIPNKDLQQKLLKNLTAQPFNGLLPKNESYSLVAPLDSLTSFNCTKWLVLQIYSAKENSNSTPKLIQIMEKEYIVTTKKPFFIVRNALKKKPDVNWDELSPPDQVHTITVDSLYQSPLFVKKLYYHQAKK